VGAEACGGERRRYDLVMAAVGVEDPLGFALFNTSVGWCGIAWTEVGVCALQLPEHSREATWSRMHRRFPDAPELSPPVDVAKAIEGISSLLADGMTDLSFVTTDLSGVPEFHQAVYEVAVTIPPGSTMTYGEVAGRLGDPGAARAVGQALGQNPIAIVVPCHRVVGANGKPGGFSGGDGVATKMKLLTIEGAPIAAQRSLFDD
jgi:methylated-DNA-[protein]-cysteine S-methyltransferase